VSDIHFRGLRFVHTDWDSPVVWGKWIEPEKPRNEWKPRDSYKHFERNNRAESAEAVERSYATCPQAAFDVPGVIMLEHAEHCSIEDCTLDNIGWYGIDLREGCRNNRIIGNEIRNAGGGGIKLDGADAERGLDLRCHSNRVSDNHIHHVGEVFRSSVGILIIHSGRNIIEHNTLHHIYYSGISCGWRWDYEENVTRDNQILYNHIYKLGQKKLSDMGGVYTLGVQPGTVVRGNHIHDIEKNHYGGWGLYADEGSSCIVFEENIVYRTSSQCLHEHYGRQNIYRNNILAFGADGCLAFAREGSNGWVEWPRHGMTFERNIVIGCNQPMWTDYSNYLDHYIVTSGLNLYWDVSKQENVVFYDLKPFQVYKDASCKQLSLTEIQERGFEQASVIADPCFVDAQNDDFRLKKDSPAFALGFKPIDPSRAGIRPPEGRLPVSVGVQTAETFFGD